jgi:hypothetical protein
VLGSWRGAILAQTFQKDVVRFQNKPFWKKRRKIARTPLEVKEPAALAAAKMMMMIEMSQFVTRRLARHFDGLQPALFTRVLRVRYTVAIPRRGDLTFAASKTSCGLRGRPARRNASRNAARCVVFLEIKATFLLITDNRLSHKRRDIGRRGPYRRFRLQLPQSRSP